jgi:very-short-patch-repair endonuclease
VFARETPALVAVITRKKDWQFLAEQHWYRVPVRTAPEGIEDVKYVAWYQTAAFGSEKWQVNWYARVRDVSRARRIELLPDESLRPQAQEEYFRIEVDDLLHLPRPIPSRKLRRIVFIPTSLERLMVAEEINDLFMTSPIEDKLYFRLRELGYEPERQVLVREEGQGYMLDMALFTRDAKLAVECDGERYHAGREKAAQDRKKDNALAAAGWRVVRFSGPEILGDTDQCVRTVNKAVRAKP